ncbi:MAG: hypothetical protein IPO92_19135 [Saprospiraceae bacterium]|nr:hypothetical protein [Saprospiraceae bacterium]
MQDHPMVVYLRLLTQVSSWYPISAFVASLGISGIAINYNNPDIIYILTGDGDESSNGAIVDTFGYRSACNGVYKTVNGGANWSKLPDFPGVSPSTMYRGRNLIIHPTDPTILFAATSIGLYKTINSGVSWAIVTGNENIWDVKFKPASPRKCIMQGNNNIKRSTDEVIILVHCLLPVFNNANRISIAVTLANPNKIALLAGRSDIQNSLQGVFISNQSGDNF